MKTDKEITLESLRKIYNELPKLAETRTHIKDDFDMGTYGVYNLLNNYEMKHECATHGCGLGNSALVFEVKPTDFTSTDRFSYVEFGTRILPSCYDEEGDEQRLWNFLFSANWSSVQPSFKNFIERVKYAIDTELELGEWDYEPQSFIKQ
jgi:hypothetical protein